MENKEKLEEKSPSEQGKKVPLIANNLNIVIDKYGLMPLESIYYMKDYVDKCPELIPDEGTLKVIELRNLTQDFPEVIEALKEAKSSDNLVVVCSWINLDVAEEIMVRYCNFVTLVVAVDVHSRQYERTRDGYRVNVINLCEDENANSVNEKEKSVTTVENTEVDKLKEKFYKTHLYDYIGNDIDSWKDKTIMLVWSGGADSTLLLHELSMFCKLLGKKLYVVHVNTPLLNKRKRSMETNAMEATYDRIRQSDPSVYCEIKSCRLDIDGTENLFDTPRTTLSLPQQTMWALYTSLMAPEKTRIFFGYIEEDHFWHYKESFVNLIYWFNKCTGKDIITDYPYEYVGKVEIIKKLLEMGIYEDTWSCEQVEGICKPCGKCRPCHENITALTELTLDGNTKARNALKSRYGKEL